MKAGLRTGGKIQGFSSGDEHDLKGSLSKQEVKYKDLLNHNHLSPWTSHTLECFLEGAWLLQYAADASDGKDPREMCISLSDKTGCGCSKV